MPESEEWAGDPLAWPSEPLCPCPLLWALGGSHCWLQWYRDTHTRLPCSLQLPHGREPPHLNVHLGAAAAAALMVCASGEAFFPHSTPTGHVGSGAARIHAQTLGLDTCSSCGPTAN